MTNLFTVFFLCVAMLNVIACAGVTFCYERIAELYKLDVRDVEFYNLLAALFGGTLWTSLAITCCLF